MNAAAHLPSSAVAASPTPQARAALHMLRLNGEALNLIWNWPESLPQTSLAQVFEALALPMPEHTREELARCTLWLGSDAGEPMSFSHECRKLRCSRNGQTVPPGHRVSLQDDAWMEVGLCRWSVWMPRSAPTDATATAGVCRPDAAAGNGSDLQLLADGVGEPISNLLGAPWSEGLPDLITGSAAEDGSNADQEQPLVAVESADPLATWHRRYLHHLQFPHEPDHSFAWTADSTVVRHPDSGARAMLDPLNRLIDQYGNSQSLGHMLGQCEDIGTVLSALPQQEGQDILDNPMPDNVLYLFAPDDWQAPDDRFTLPLLSRMEHHGMAIDSAISSADLLAGPLAMHSPSESADLTEKS